MGSGRITTNFAFRILLAVRQRLGGGWSRREKRRKALRAFLSAIGDDGVPGVIPEGMWTTVRNTNLFADDVAVDPADHYLGSKQCQGERNYH
jgi:hypothetical protein